MVSSGERVDFIVASTAARDVLDRAARASLTAKEHRVLEAIVSRTALYSKLEDRVWLAQIAAHAHGVDRAEKWMLEKTRVALVRLRDAGLIRYRPPRGRPPADHAGPGYVIGLVASEHHPSTGGANDGTPQAGDAAEGHPSMGEAKEETPPTDGWSDAPETPPNPVGNTTSPRGGTPPSHGGPREKISGETSGEREDLLARATQLVTRRPGEVADLMSVLLADHSPDILEQALAEVLASRPGVRFRWTSELDAALASHLPGPTPEQRATHRDCDSCHGTRWADDPTEPGEPPRLCSRCEGTGRLLMEAS